MSSKDNTGGITPGDLGRARNAVMEATGYHICFVMDVPADYGAAEGFQLLCEARRPSFSGRSGADYSARIPWPCSTHKTVIGALYWLLMDVEKQLTARAALAWRDPA